MSAEGEDWAPKHQKRASAESLGRGKPGEDGKPGDAPSAGKEGARGSQRGLQLERREGTDCRVVHTMASAHHDRTWTPCPAPGTSHPFICSALSLSADPPCTR